MTASKKLKRTLRLPESIKQEMECQATVKNERQNYRVGCTLEAHTAKKVVLETLKKGRETNKSLAPEETNL